jgi:soluble lytic murein transglycosylase-like protein/tetratricopeptide (TPR) repeat protein
VAAVLVAAAAAHAGTPRLEPTREGVRWFGATLSGDAPRGPAPVEAWWVAARDSGLAGTAVLCPLADTLAARGDTARAEQLLALPRLARSLWAWDALRRRATYALARRDFQRAGELLGAADRKGWPASEEAAWRAMQAPILVAVGDTLEGEALARGVLENYAGVVPASGEAVKLLDQLARVRGEPFAPRLARRAAAAQWANGARAEALARLAALADRVPPEERGTDAVQRAQWLREWRRPLAAIAVAETALGWTRGTPAWDRARLERARACRDARRTDTALGLYQDIGRTADDPVVRMTAWWECGREAQDDSRWPLAGSAFRLADSLGTVYHNDLALVQGATTLAGLMDWMRGERGEAVRAWRAVVDRRARFWLGVALHQRRVAEGDSILRSEFAEQPGYDLLSVAARDTLHLASWPGEVAPPLADSLEPRLTAAVVALAGPLELPDAAARIVAARDHHDPRVPGGAGRGISVASWRAIAVAAYAGGDLASGTRAADRALLSAPADGDAWAWVPWAFPPAYERELAAAADEAGVERALLWALVRQESRFDPRAVSRSNARGLTQLLSGTARDMARELHESFPADTLVFEPSRSLRYGARYLRQLLDRFDGSIPVALTAYNAGAGNVRADWRDVLARGGWALYCEMAANADTQDYVRRILGYRQAYRDLRPSAGEGP